MLVSKTMEELGDTPAVGEHFDGALLEVPAQVVNEPELMCRDIQLVMPDVHVFPDAILVLAKLFRVAQRQVDGVAAIFHAHCSYDMAAAGWGAHRDRVTVVHVDYRLD
jgi:hypothetical protein